MIINRSMYEKVTRESLGKHSKYILLFEDEYDHPASVHGYLDVKTQYGGLPNLHRTGDLTLISEKRNIVLPYGYSLIYDVGEWVLSSSRGWKLWGEIPIVNLDGDDDDCV